MLKTLLKITFFSLLIIGFAVIQYSWLRSIQKDKLEKFRSNVIKGIHGSAMAIPVDNTRNKLVENYLTPIFPRKFAAGNLDKASDTSKYILNETTLTAILHQSFASENLGTIPFEYSIVSGNNRFATRGFDQTQLNNSRHLVYYYQFHGQGKGSHANDQLIVVIPSWEKSASDGMGLLIAASLILTTFLVVVFYYTFFMIGQKQQMLYENRTKVIKGMMQQLETPLTTISVAAEALRNEVVMHDSGKINYYQQVINDENKRMNEQVNKSLRDLQ